MSNTNDNNDAPQDAAGPEPLAAELQRPIESPPPSYDTVVTSDQTTPMPHSSNSLGGSLDHWVGRSFGKYEITEVLGKGGMGIVLKAHDELIDRDVAIKVLADHFSADTSALSRFLSEAQAAGQLSHPNVTSIYEVGQENDQYFIVMEFAAGGSLADQLEQRGALSLLGATRAMVDACRGIAAAHAADLIHRDLKPANLIRFADGSVKVTDFGLAKAKTVIASQHRTQAGTILGSPFYMSPEQCRGESIDLRSDIYSLGATFYSLLTGRIPYQESGSIPDVMYAHCHNAIPDPRAIDRSIPLAFSRIVAKAMAKEPAERYQSADEMLSDLQVVKATLSGETLNLLPSDSGALQAAPQPIPRDPAANSELMTTIPRSWQAGISVALLAVIATLVAFWNPWRTGPYEQRGKPLVPLPSGEPIKVGILHSLTGTMSSSERVLVDAALFAIDEINQSGGVLGRPVEPIIADGRSNPETFASEAERLIQNEQVHAIFGCWTSACRKRVRDVVEEHNHLLVYPLQFEGLEQSPNIVYMGAAPNQQILPALRWAVEELGKRRFFLVGSDYIFPHAAGAIIADEISELGAEIVGTKYLPLGSSEVQPIVDAIVDAKPDMILNAINGDSNTNFFRALRRAGIRAADCPTLSFSIDEAEIRNLDARLVAGDYLAWSYFQTLDNQENQQFVSRFQRTHPHRTITASMENAYDSVRLWAKAANATASVDPNFVRRAMLQQRFASPDGEVRIDPSTQYSYKTPRIGQIQEDETIQVVWQSANPVRPQAFPESRTAEQWLALLHDLYIGWGRHWSAP